ncbi:hypothetical protein GTP23_21465 [Pseudoduganella sp. FT93W]|uniref:Uncharacterized protein n=1 Tax=Duganella fentianensis TaxID=2692177 RepID=A0A845I225_9BURK|nr:hypothetical protein [Duganella fentianensis]MYN47614.1 hypothetical protein [Duganella fentianensis]
MNKNIVITCVAIILALNASAEEFIQSKSSYDAAVQGSFVNVTTSPAYVKIIVVNATTGDEKVLCTTANFLAGALHIQHALSYDLNGRKQVADIALNNIQHKFILDERAIQNLPAAHTLDELHEVKLKFSPLTNEELIRGLRPIGGELHYAFPDRRYRGAIACVLIERGLSPYQADITGQVNIRAD